MKKLFAQLVKFGMVGAFCFVIDFAITMGLTWVGIHHLIAAFFGFVVSVVANYLLSFKFVFERKEDMNRQKEFAVFVVLSVIGLGINEGLIYLSVDILYGRLGWLAHAISYELAVASGKIFATAVVMVYNFVTRKIFLEKKEKRPS